jgi:hypothetical protein
VLSGVASAQASAAVHLAEVGTTFASGLSHRTPVTTSTLLSNGKTAPRTVIGSVSASEFLVAVSASLGFLAGLREEFLHNIRSSSRRSSKKRWN